MISGTIYGEIHHHRIMPRTIAIVQCIYNTKCNSHSKIIMRGLCFCDTKSHPNNFLRNAWIMGPPKRLPTNLMSVFTTVCKEEKWKRGEKVSLVLGSFGFYEMLLATVMEHYFSQGVFIIGCFLPIQELVMYRIPQLITIIKYALAIFCRMSISTKMCDYWSISMWLHGVNLSILSSAQMKTHIAAYNNYWYVNHCLNNSTQDGTCLRHLFKTLRNNMENLDTDV